MQIDEVKKEKEIIQETIFKVIQQELENFYQNTGLSIEKIHIEMKRKTNPGASYSYFVSEVKIQIDL